MPRLVAFAPAAFLAFAAADNLRDGTWWNLLWICNVCNALLAAALATGWSRGVWLATLCLVAGAPLWLLDALLTRSFELHSFFTHLCAPAVGLLALRGAPRARGIVWQAVAFGVALQVATRLVTPAAANVNVAFAAWAPVAAIFPSFAAAWAANVALLAAMLAALEPLVYRTFSRRKSSDSTR